MRQLKEAIEALAGCDFAHRYVTVWSRKPSSGIWSKSDWIKYAWFWDFLLTTPNRIYYNWPSDRSTDRPITIDYRIWVWERICFGKLPTAMLCTYTPPRNLLCSLLDFSIHCILITDACRHIIIFRSLDYMPLLSSQYTRILFLLSFAFALCCASSTKNFCFFYKFWCFFFCSFSCLITVFGLSQQVESTLAQERWHVDGK